MNKEKTEKKIEKLNSKLAVLKKQRIEFLKQEEEENQELPKKKKRMSRKEKKEAKKREAELLETGHEKERKEAEAKKIMEIQYSYLKQSPLFYAERKSVKEFVAPDALDPNNYGYVKVIDAGRNVYLRNYYIEKMPRNARFASTFSELYNMTNIMSQTRIEPIENAQAIQKLDSQIRDLDTELSTAQKAGNRNRYRKIQHKMGDTEGWARELESGRNRIFNVTMMFQSYADSLEKLNAQGADFHTKALGKNISVVSCYGSEPEAYKSGFTVNQIFSSKKGPIKTTTAKVHQMDLYSLATIFNHTRSSFYHKNGVYLGRDLSTHRPITFDPYDPSVEAHNIIFAGKTGTGKSATIKMFLSRAADFGLKYCSVDMEAKGTQGEYSILTSRLGGANYKVSANSKEIVNLFEVSEEQEYDENTGQENTVLHLIEKISIISGILVTMITYGKKEQPTFQEATVMEAIIEDIVAYLFEIRGIQDGEPESLYAATAGYTMTKKPLPTITELYIEVLKRQKRNTYEHHTRGYALILDGLKKYVRELYYVPDIVKILTGEEYNQLPMDNEGHRYYEMEDGKQRDVIAIRGTRPFYDGQSTIKVDLDTPAINIDVSQLPENDRPLGLVIASNYLNENIIKKNSANPKKLRKRAILLDEAHRTFPYPELRRFWSDLYRSARKRYIAPICCTQSLEDFRLYDETKEIVKQSPMIFLLRQDAVDKDYIRETTQMSPGQMDRLFRLGGATEDGGAAEKGQVCLVINKRAIFVQIDYLKETEMDVVETDQQKIFENVRRRRKKRENEKKAI